MYLYCNKCNFPSGMNKMSFSLISVAHLTLVNYSDVRALVSFREKSTTKGDEIANETHKIQHNQHLFFPVLDFYFHILISVDCLTFVVLFLKKSSWYLNRFSVSQTYNPGCEILFIHALNKRLPCLPFYI